MQSTVCHLSWHSTKYKCQYQNTQTKEYVTSSSSSCYHGLSVTDKKPQCSQVDLSPFIPFLGPKNSQATVDAASTKFKSHIHLQLGSSSTSRDYGTHRVHYSPAAALGLLSEGSQELKGERRKAEH